MPVSYDSNCWVMLVFDSRLSLYVIPPLIRKYIFFTLWFVIYPKTKTYKVETKSFTSHYNSWLKINKTFSTSKRKQPVALFRVIQKSGDTLISNNKLQFLTQNLRQNFQPKYWISTFNWSFFIGIHSIRETRKRGKQRWKAYVKAD